MQRGDQPYQLLGKELSRIRQREKESIAEVSGAVEVDDERFGQFERGEIRPSEDILMLLIAHFGIKDEEAERLWELAGYDSSRSPQPSTPENQAVQSQTLMVLPLDARIVYTDRVNVTINNYGVVMNFMQSSGIGQHYPAARVGMSLEHAKSVMEVLQKTIAQATKPKITKFLPAPRNNKSKKHKKI